MSGKRFNTAKQFIFPNVPAGCIHISGDNIAGSPVKADKRAIIEKLVLDLHQPLAVSFLCGFFPERLEELVGPGAFIPVIIPGFHILGHPEPA